MNAIGMRCVLGGAWAASLALAFWAGSHVPAPSGSRTRGLPTEAISSARPPRSSLGGDHLTPTSAARSPAPGSAVSSSSAPADVAAIIAAAVNTLAPGTRWTSNQADWVRAMGPLLELPPEQIEMALAEVARIVETPQHRQAVRSLLLSRWVEHDPEAAVRHAETLAREDVGGNAASVFGTVVGTWAGRDPEAAWRWYSAQRDQDAFADLPFATQSFPNAIFSSLAARDLDLALNRMARLGEPRERLMATMGIAGAATQPETWGRIFESTAGFDDQSRRNARSSMVGQWAATNFDATLDFLRGLPVEEQGPLLDSAGFNLMFQQPEKAAGFLLENATEGQLAQRYNTVIGSWASRNPNAAGEWLNRQPPAPVQDQARANFARTVAQRDPEAALAWAGTVMDDKQRVSALTSVFNLWARQDDAAARSALSRSELTPEVQNSILDSLSRQTQTTGNQPIPTTSR